MGKTQSDFAEHYGVDEQTIRNWEHGRRKVPENVIQNLVDSLGIDEQFIKGKSEDPRFLETLDMWDIGSPDMAKEVNQFGKLIDYIEDLTGEKVPASIEPDLSETKQEIDDFIIFKYKMIKERNKSND